MDLHTPRSILNQSRKNTNFKNLLFEQYKKQLTKISETIPNEYRNSDNINNENDNINHYTENVIDNETDLKKHKNLCLKDSFNNKINTNNTKTAHDYAVMRKKYTLSGKKSIFNLTNKKFT